MSACSSCWPTESSQSRDPSRRYYSPRCGRVEAMKEDARQRWKERRLLLRQMIEEKRRSAHAPDQRRYRALVSVGLITAAIVLAGVLTTWVKMCHRLETTATLASPSPAAISPVPTPPESQAVTSPVPSPQESASPAESPVVTSPAPPREESAGLRARPPSGNSVRIIFFKKASRFLAFSWCIFT
jgi:hypothetical protein